MLALLVQPASREMTHPLCIVQFLKIECSMLIMPLLKPVVHSQSPPTSDLIPSKQQTIRPTDNL